ncbi:MAG: hypothetical protein ACRESJ_05500, partial [Pseudomonas sp.]|uniref:hypothetical protein n=1 Tax=Pseudomonas sp. TaxID=306 RepID=UPI003D6FEBFA
DHPVFSCSESEQKQLNTWVSFQSAEQPLLGQFSVSGNRSRAQKETDMPTGYPISAATILILQTLGNALCAMP